jgi:hypothetical protein
MDQGGSIKIDSQIFPDFVQVQTVFSDLHGIRTLLFEFNDKDHKVPPPSCLMWARVLQSHSDKYNQFKVLVLATNVCAGR